MRKQAIRILEQARETLATRLAARIVEDEAGILEDADGQSFMDEIAGADDQLGRKLHRVTRMLQDLKNAPKPAKSRKAVAALPAPKAPIGMLAAPRAASLQTFASHIQSGNIDAAGYSLASIFSLDRRRGVHCAKHFDSQLHSCPDFYLKTLRLRRELFSGNLESVVALLNDCFGLTNLESIHVVQKLRKQSS